MTPLKELFHSETLSQTIRTELSRVGGATLVVGTYGSGRTHTLYSLLADCLREQPERVAITVEERVMVTLEGVFQADRREVGSSFEELIQGALEQRPELLMVDPLDGLDALGRVLDAALDSVTVLASLRSESLAEALDLVGSSAPEWTSGLRLLVGQRLLRRVCPHCRQQADPSR